MPERLLHLERGAFALATKIRTVFLTELLLLLTISNITPLVQASLAICLENESIQHLRIDKRLHNGRQICLRAQIYCITFPFKKVSKSNFYTFSFPFSSFGFWAFLGPLDEEAGLFLS